MLIPNNIQKGDKIGIVAPARFIRPEQYVAICQYVEQQGFVPILGQTTHLESGIFAGTDTERAADLQQMIDNPEISAILCVRGGYGCIRMVDKVDFRPLLNTPKWIVGFSDVTVLHSTLSNLGVASIHGQMPVNFSKPNSSADALFALLQGEASHYRFASNYNRQGTTTAKLAGGNLSILCSLIGTPYMPNFDGKILFIEDVGEPLYRIDRMMQQLKHAGLLSKLTGLLVGYFTDAEDSTPSFKMTAEQIVLDAAANFDFPIAFGFQAGHQQPNLPLIIGGQYRFNVENYRAELKFEQSA